jgi:DNA (cytosine-5)-methyltransferase 1
MKQSTRDDRAPGRPRALDDDDQIVALSELEAGNPAQLVAQTLGVSRSTIQRLKRDKGLVGLKTSALPPHNRRTMMSKTETRMMELARDAAAHAAAGGVQLAAVPAERTAEDSTRKVFRLGELFSGPGGIGVGAARASISDARYRIQHQWANDFDLDTCRTYARNVMGDVNSPAVIHGDVRTLDFGRLKQIGDIDGLAFGFPCNDFSVVGERKGFDGTFGPLYTYGIKALEMFRPAFFLAENVGGLTSNAGGQALRQILTDMRMSGYRLVPHLYKFEQYGVPQARHRIIIIGIRDDLDVTFEVPSPEPYGSVDVSSRAALTKPPIPSWATNQELTRQSSTVVERLRLIGEGQSAFTADLPEELQIKTATKISQIYKRLDSAKPSYTITGSGGGGTHVYHWAEPRALTNRERARLQTFPDDFVFEGSKESVRKQVGMAVPARGAQVIFEAVLKSFAGESYPSVRSSFPVID